jgi:hypothetical protein
VAFRNAIIRNYDRFGPAPANLRHYFRYLAKKEALKAKADSHMKKAPRIAVQGLYFSEWA